MGEISSLEIRGIEARDEEIRRSDYNSTNTYSEETGDMLGVFKKGDKRKIGTDSPGHGDWLPNPNGTINEFVFSNFDTSLESKAGTKVDIETRNNAMRKSLYSPQSPYGDVTITPRDGQYYIQ